MDYLHESACREILLQHSWNNIPKYTNLKSSDGQNVIVIYRGTWNVEDGPDFKNAVISIDGRILKGDIEIHNTASDWMAHGHDGDPNYSNVILHILGSPEREDRNAPCITSIVLPVELCLSRKRRSIFNRGLCASSFKTASIDSLKSYFEKYGFYRLSKKSLILTSEIYQDGPHHTLMRNIFEVLGYKNNRDAFRELYSRLGKYDLSGMPGPEIEAVVWGESGLLPDFSQKKYDEETTRLLRNLWASWWRLRSGCTHEQLKYHLSCSRPFNSPFRRIAAAAILLTRFRNNPFHELSIKALEKHHTSKELVKSISLQLACSDSYWDNHSAFGSRIAKKASVLGKSRILEIIVNAILPFMKAYCVINRPELDEKISSFWLEIPAVQGNIFKKISLARWGMDYNKSSKVFRTAAALQGCIHIHKNICEFSSQNCEDCPVPAEIARNL